MALAIEPRGIQYKPINAARAASVAWEVRFRNHVFPELSKGQESDSKKARLTRRLSGGVSESQGHHGKMQQNVNRVALLASGYLDSHCGKFMRRGGFLSYVCREHAREVRLCPLRPDYLLRPLEKKYHNSESPPVRGNKRICLNINVRRLERSFSSPAFICV